MVVCTNGRACYFPAPYTDAHGDKMNAHNARGKPLKLDHARYCHTCLVGLWLIHYRMNILLGLLSYYRIPIEVTQKRSPSSLVVIITYY